MTGKVEPLNGPTWLGSSDGVKITCAIHHGPRFKFRFPGKSSPCSPSPGPIAPASLSTLERAPPRDSPGLGCAPHQPHFATKVVPSLLATLRHRSFWKEPPGPEPLHLQTCINSPPLQPYGPITVVPTTLPHDDCTLGLCEFGKSSYDSTQPQGQNRMVKQTAIY